MSRNIELSDGKKIEIHYVYNKNTGEFDDFKFKDNKWGADILWIILE